MSLKVYIAGPITKGDQLANVGRAIDMANELLDLGFVPFCPHPSAFLQMRRPRTHADWLDYDKRWLSECDCILRLPGESIGADMEQAWAADLGLPVFTSIEALQSHRSTLLRAKA